MARSLYTPGSLGHGKSLEQWEESLRTHLVQKGKLSQRKGKSLLSTQEYREYLHEDERIRLLRRLFKTIGDVYDDRPETEKDIWDAHAMGLPPDATSRYRFLDFTPIPQSWLRFLAKEFLKYRTANRSMSTCAHRLYSIVAFSRFLTQHYPAISASDVDRAVMSAYISYLKERKISDIHRLHLLTEICDFFETCALRLGIEGLVRDRLIFSDDLPALPERESREIPEPVLEQLREHLETLPTTMLRMVVILLECGMRIGELCTLPLDCLVGNEEQGWYLRSYQSKMKQEHIIPLVDPTVIGAIQAQQRDMCEQWGSTCPYLFPRTSAHRLPFSQGTFRGCLNRWALEREIRDTSGKLYRFQAHQFRHSLGMRLLNEDVPIEVIGRLLGHHSFVMTQVYARKRIQKQREELERVARRRKTVNYLGQVVTGDVRANDPEAQLLRRGIRGQTLPVGG
jgi:integrase/recombinase XerD